MRGDILLFRSDGKWYQRIICRLTHGPFVHVGVDLGDGTNIAAHPRGVSISNNPDSDQCVSVDISSRTTPDHLFYAMEWLHGQVGKPYGWVDIVDYALGVLGLPIFFFQKNHHDCSTLVALYLDHLYLKEMWSEYPDLVSPNDIARMLKVI